MSNCAQVEHMKSVDCRSNAYAGNRPFVVITTLNGKELKDRVTRAFVSGHLTAFIALPATDKRATLVHC